MFTSVVQILSYETVASVELRRKRAKEIYDKCIYADMLAMSSAVSGGWRVVEKWREEDGGVEGSGWRVGMEGGGVGGGRIKGEMRRVEGSGWGKGGGWGWREEGEMRRVVDGGRRGRVMGGMRRVEG